MHKQAVITDLNYKPQKHLLLAQILPFGQCLNCTELCNKKNRCVPVKNPKGFEIKQGSNVIISYTKTFEYILSIFLLLLPVVLCFLSWYFTSNFKLMCVSLTAGLFTDWLISRAKKFIAYPVIIDVL